MEGQSLQIMDYHQNHNTKFKAVRNCVSTSNQEAFVLNFQVIKKDLIPEEDLLSKFHDFHLCPGILESEILPLMSNFVNANLACVMFFIEKICDQVFYRSRNCQFVYQESSSKLCKPCEDLFQNLFDLFRNLQETPSIDTVKMEVEPDQDVFEPNGSQYDNHYDNSHESVLLKKEKKDVVKSDVPSQSFKFETEWTPEDSDNEQEELFQDSYQNNRKNEKKSNHECYVCEKAFVTRKRFLNHCLTQHRDDPSFSDVIEKLKSESINKNRIHKKEKKYNCPSCFKRFSSHKCLVSHCRKEHDIIIPESEPQTIKEKCPFCEKKFNPQSERFVSHLMTFHCAERGNPIFLEIVNNKMIKQYVCQICGNSFSNHQSLDHHLMKMHENQSNNCVPCHICGKALKNNTSLNAHLLLHRNDNCLCTICGASYKNEVKLKRHMLTHSQEQFPCSECGRLFKTTVHLRRHVRFMHLKEKTAQCDQCDKRFPDLSKLRTHISSVHTKVKPYVCELCGFKCARVDNLNIHRKKSHGITETISRATLEKMVANGEHPYCSLVDLPMLQLQSYS